MNVSLSYFTADLTNSFLWKVSGISITVLAHLALYSVPTIMASDVVRAVLNNVSAVDWNI